MRRASHYRTQLNGIRWIVSVLIIALSVAWTLPATAQSTTHFSKCTSQTGVDATVILPATAHITMDQDAIAVGDEIAVFTPDGHCAGTITWTGENAALTVWGADAVNPDRGAFQTGEPMVFRAWDASTDRVLGGDSAFRLVLRDHEPYFTTDNRFVPNGIYVIDALHLYLSPQASR